MSNKRINHQIAFTLIEILVTVSLTAIIMLGVTSLFITLITVAGKARLSQNIRENGTVAMQKMIEELRSAVEVTSTCNGSELQILNFSNKDGEASTLQTTSNRIALIRGTTYFLTSDSNNNQLSNLRFRCFATDTSKYIEIRFTLASSTNSPSPTSSRLDFRSGVSLRN